MCALPICFGGGTRRTKDRAAVLAQHLQPRAEIIGVADGRGDAERGAEEGRTHFGDQFFAGIILAAETVGQAAAQALRVAGRVRQFVQAGPVIIDLLEERSEEHTSELQSLMRIPYAVFCLNKKTYWRRYTNTYEYPRD